MDEKESLESSESKGSRSPGISLKHIFSPTSEKRSGGAPSQSPPIPLIEIESWDDRTENFGQVPRKQKNSLPSSGGPNFSERGHGLREKRKVSLLTPLNWMDRTSSKLLVPFSRKHRFLSALDLSNLTLTAKNIGRKSSTASADDSDLPQLSLAELKALLTKPKSINLDFSPKDEVCRDYSKASYDVGPSSTDVLCSSGESSQTIVETSKSDNRVPESRTFLHTGSKLYIPAQQVPINTLLSSNISDYGIHASKSTSDLETLKQGDFKNGNRDGVTIKKLLNPKIANVFDYPLLESMMSLTQKALVSFILEDNHVGLQNLLENRRVLVDDKDENGVTALMVASQKGKAIFFRSLLEHGADINAEDGDNWTPLLFAAKEGHDEIVADLLEHGADVDHKDMGGWTALMWACYKGRTKTARLLMERNADVNSYGHYHVTCLGWAAGRGHTDIVKDLITHGAKVNSGDKYGTTPLIWACRRGFTEIVDTLLNADAIVDACGMTSWTPLLVATSGNHVEVVKALLEHKPSINALDKDGCSALTIACKEGFHEIAVSLINHGAYININDRGGTSNLIHAAKGGHRSIIEVLLKKHADVNVQGKDRKTALYWAVEKSHLQVVKLLLSVVPDLEIATKDGDTPLMKAVRNRNAEIVSLLLDKKAKVSAADKNGDTCLHIAMRARSKQIVELLLRNPVHSQLLYRPNRAGETPYNIDRASAKPIMPQIFGSRLNTQEDGENLLGYNLYSSALADMLSDPTLNMPITIGLYARWGSGKSFLLGKLREEMKSFARQWLSPMFSWDLLVFVVVLCFSAVIGVIAGLALHNWIVGVAFLSSVMIIIHIFFMIVWICSRKEKYYEWSWSHKLSNYMAVKTEAMRLICQIIFCHPPGSQASDQMHQAQPINFYFTEQTKISSTTGSENSVVQMLASLYSSIENDYGVVSTRLYRAFRPRPVAATADWKFRKLCCIPYCVIFLFCFACILVGSTVLALYMTKMDEEYASKLSIQIIMYSCALVVSLLIVANLHTVGQIMTSIVFSQRKHLQRAVSTLLAVKSEGFMQALKSEVKLMNDMVQCLDSFTGRQSRLVVIVDGLDSGEQEKVLQVLDAVNILFNDLKSPFIILLAIDPHIIAKGIEMNINPVLNESNIGGNDYLRNVVHLPFFLQNSALRKVKHVKTLESSMKRNSRILEEDPGPQIILSTRRPSTESGFGIPMPLERFDKTQSKKTKRLGLKLSESVASSLASNLHKATSNAPLVGGPNELKKMLLGDDYFSDVNPRSMRRLMNVIHITGRLLKSFSIDFNWYHLSTWINVTEQWPYRLSWMIIYCEHFQKDLDDGLSLKVIFDRVRPFVPTSKDVDANVILDRDEKKLDVYLSMHKGSLLVSSLYIFLPFTISLDPQLRKDISEQYQPIDQIFKLSRPDLENNMASMMGPPSPTQYLTQQQNALASQLKLRTLGAQPGVVPVLGAAQPQYQVPVQVPSYNVPTQILPPFDVRLQNNYFPFHQTLPVFNQAQAPFPYGVPTVPPPIKPNLTSELKCKKLSDMSTEDVVKMLGTVILSSGQDKESYQDSINRNNINGAVLYTCDLNDLKLVLQMTFGDWEIFKSTIVSLRGEEQRAMIDGSQTQKSDTKNNNSSLLLDPQAKDVVRINVTPDSPMDTSQKSKEYLPRPNVLEKQVTMEDQMICGALEFLNDQAREDAKKAEDSVSGSTLSPMKDVLDSGNENVTPVTRGSLSQRTARGMIPQEETDVLYVSESPHNVTAELPDSPGLLRKLGELENTTRISVINENQMFYPESDKGFYPVAMHGQSGQSSFSGSRGAFKTPVYQQQGRQEISREITTPQKSSSRKRLVRKQSSQTPLESLEGEEYSSEGVSSDESQSPLMSKPHYVSRHLRKGSKSDRSNLNSDEGSEKPKRKSKEQREDSYMLTRFKESLQLESRDDHVSLSMGSNEKSTLRNTQKDRAQTKKPVRYNLPSDESEPSQYFKDHGRPWTLHRAPTPLPRPGSVEYYESIKSNNPSPTTTDQSEIATTPEVITSKEELFIPDPTAEALNVLLVPDVPHDLCSSPSPPPNSTTTSQHVPTDSRNRPEAEEDKTRRMLSSVSKLLKRSYLNKSDPGLASSSSRSGGDIEVLFSKDQKTPKPPEEQQLLEQDEYSFSEQHRDQYPSLRRQSAFDPNSSSRENTPF